LRRKVSWSAWITPAAFLPSSSITLIVALTGVAFLAILVFIAELVDLVFLLVTYAYPVPSSSSSPLTLTLNAIITRTSVSVSDSPYPGMTNPGNNAAGPFDAA
jgi:hypothetical protein